MAEKEILITSIVYPPNVGGVETHLFDLVSALTKRSYFCRLLTYKPITTQVKAPFIETSGNFQIIRIPWFRGVFYKLVKNPLLEFLFLLPGLFFGIPVILVCYPKIKIIHSHGLVAGFASIFWAIFFGKKVIVTTHSYYNFPATGLYRSFAGFIFNQADQVLCLSNKSKAEVESLGVSKTKIKVFRYWINTDLFNVNKKISMSQKKLKFLFVGRLIEEKGIGILLDIASKTRKIAEFVISGVGPMEQIIQKNSQASENIKYIGKIDQKNLPDLYNQADMTIVPSIHEEGYGRVIIESLSCGTPVLASNIGAISEVIDESVGILVEPTVFGFVNKINFLVQNRGKIVILSKSCRKYALFKFSEDNVEMITKTYE